MERRKEQRGEYDHFDMPYAYIVGTYMVSHGGTLKLTS